MTTFTLSTLNYMGYLLLAGSFCAGVLYCIGSDSLKKVSVYILFVLFVLTSVLWPLRLQYVSQDNGLPFVFVLAQWIPFAIYIHYSYKTKFLSMFIAALGGEPEED